MQDSGNNYIAPRPAGSPWTPRRNDQLIYGGNMKNELSKKHCVPSKKEMAPLKGDDLKTIHEQLNGDWTIVDEHHLEKKFIFRNFRQALAFTNQVGELAEAEGHHPDIYLAWGKVKLTIWTHTIDGLTESDFILAAKVEEL
ncbi:Pterin-4-alpha-carbinolamine dehydratase (EC [Olavius algarvensis Delta 1 endosymbiont]|nr:Pterin-4-alpha-carbinolamine dehydratase (EC [Olavius algarvensis Delta 1 endosymbiont]